MADFGTIGLAGVMAAWPLFGVAFIRRRGAPRGQSQTREPVAWAGIALQAVAFACIWSFRRDPAGALMFPDRPALSAAIAVASVLLAWACAGMVFWAIRTLGRQWAVSASLVEGHELVTTGPYRFVRNPIYAGLFGMAMATAGVYSRPWTIVVGAPLFLAGTLVRVRAEERLLRERFGARYDDFARRVPALLPKLKPWP
jgi:protein-S-isoprenylcysteine O-methyltransferase Ste14